MVVEEPYRRVEAYILNVEQAVNNIDYSRLDEETRRVIDIVKSYLHDAKHYLGKKDWFTALACIAYAEGLLDSLRYQGLLDIHWKPLSKLLKRPRVLVTGAFEIIHPGHLYLFRKAWELGEVYVIVARDRNFKKFKSREPVIPEEQRRIVVESIKYVSKAILGDEEDYLKPVLEIKPDIILLGPDQWINPEDLEEKLRDRGLETRVLKLDKRIDEGLYSVSRIIKKIVETHCK